MTTTEDELDTVLNDLERAHESEPLPPAVATTEYLSPILAQLEKKRRPNPLPLCATCPNSLWFASAEHLQSYCRVMHVVTWRSEEPKPILACDGILIGDR